MAQYLDYITRPIENKTYIHLSCCDAQADKRVS